MVRENDFAALMTMLVSAPVSAENCRVILKQWEGRCVDDLLQHAGQPTSIFKSADGNEVFKYSLSTSAVIPILSYHDDSFSTLETVPEDWYATFGNNCYWCDIFFEVNEQAIIAIVYMEGNCFSPEP